MRKTWTIVVIGLWLAVMLAAPGVARAQNREHQQISADIRMLQEQTQQLAITLSALSTALNEALRDLNARLDETNDMAVKGFADQRLVIDGLGTDLRVIRERVDETNVRVSTLGQEVDALRSTIPLIGQPAADGTADAGAGLAGNAPPGGGAPGGSALGLSPTRMYEQAFADYAGGQWTLAITGFEAFLRTFPMSEQADDAQFYLGETYFNQNLMQDAVAAYDRVIDNYPGGDQTPIAYYKRGLAQERLGQLDAARESWQQVVTDYPDSDPGRLAQQNLERLNRQETAP